MFELPLGMTSIYHQEISHKEAPHQSAKGPLILCNKVRSYIASCYVYAHFAFINIAKNISSSSSSSSSKTLVLYLGHSLCKFPYQKLHYFINIAKNISLLFLLLLLHPPNKNPSTVFKHSLCKFLYQELYTICKFPSKLI